MPLYVVDAATDGLYVVNRGTAGCRRVGDASQFGVSAGDAFGLTWDGRRLLLGDERDGVFSLDLTTGIGSAVLTGRTWNNALVFANRQTIYPGGLAYDGTKYYITRAGGTNRPLVLDLTTGGTTTLNSSSEGYINRAEGIAWDGDNNRLFVTGVSPTNTNLGGLYTVDRSNGHATFAGEFGLRFRSMDGLTWDGETLWGVNTLGNDLVSINTSTGAVTHVGNLTDHATGSELSTVTGIAWVPDTEAPHHIDNAPLYGVDSHAEALFVIDRITGESTRRGDFTHPFDYQVPYDADNETTNELMSEDKAAGLAWTGTHLYMFGETLRILFRINALTGRGTPVNPSAAGEPVIPDITTTSHNPYSMAWDGRQLFMAAGSNPHSGHLAEANLYVFNERTGGVTHVDADLDLYGINAEIINIEWDGSKLYGLGWLYSGRNLDTRVRALFEIDRNTGRATRIGTNNLSTLGSLVWDGTTMYLFDNHTVYSVNLLTGALTRTHVSIHTGNYAEEAAPGEIVQPILGHFTGLTWLREGDAERVFSEPENAAPRFTTTQVTYPLPINTGGGILVAQFSAVDDDSDSLVFSLPASNTHGNLFRIDPTDGRLFTQAALVNGTTYDLVIGVTDGDDVTTLAIQVIVAGNSRPSILTSEQRYTLRFNPPVGTQVVRIQALDPDGARDTLTYSLSGANANLFRISSEGLLLTSSAIPTAGTYRLTVRVADSENLDDTLALEVLVLAEGANVAPRWLTTQTAYSLVRPEVGDVAFRLAAVDDDGDNLVYSLIGANAALFSIGTTGVVHVGSVLARGQTYTFNAVVSDGEDSATLALTVLVRANNAPVFLTAVSQYTVPFNVPEGTIIVQMEVDDLDGDTLQFTLAGSDASLFRIDSTSGVIRTAGSLVAGTDYDVRVLVSDGRAQASLDLTISAVSLAEYIPPGITGPSSIPINPTPGDLPVGVPQIEGLYEYRERFDVLVGTSASFTVIARHVEMIRFEGEKDTELFGGLFELDTFVFVPIYPLQTITEGAIVVPATLRGPVEFPTNLRNMFPVSAVRRLGKTLRQVLFIDNSEA